MSFYGGSTSNPVMQVVNASTPPPASSIDYFVLIAMENQSYGSVIGTPFAPFINSLLSAPPPGQNSATIPQYHGAYPGSSAGSYTAVISGDTYGVSDGVAYGSVTGQTIIDGFEMVGRTWRALQESSSPSGNPAWNSGSFRGPDHFGFTQFSTITNSPARMRT